MYFGTSFVFKNPTFHNDYRCYKLLMNYMLYKASLLIIIIEKRKVSFGSVMTHIRTRLRFALLRSIVTALRGVRGRKSGSEMKDLSNVNFDFVPEGEMYESF